jgi:dihydrofolate reductase
MAGRRVVFIACSLDGFIAGPGDDLTFLEPAEGQEIEDTFTPFLAGVGVLLMGRRTFDVVSGFGGEWPYGNTPVLVLTRWAIESAVSRAVEAAGDRDVYIDGGELVRQALDANLVDELVVTVVPRILGHGTPLFAGAAQPHDLELLGQRPLGAGYVELRYRPIR